MTKPFVGQGWASDIEPLGDVTYCHMEDNDYTEDDEDRFDLEHELEVAEYWEEVMYDKYGEPLF